MESKQETASVILKLMGLDQVPAQYHPIRDRHKVLSEDYLQKVASIGIRKKRSSYQHHSIEKEESDDVLKVVKTIRRDENHNPSKGNGKENLSLYETKGVLQQLLDSAVMLKPETLVDTTSAFNHEPRVRVEHSNLLLQQKVNNRLQNVVRGEDGLCQRSMLSKSRLDLDLKDETCNSIIVVSKANPGKGGIPIKYSSFLSSRQNSRFCKQSSRSCREVSDKVSMQTGNVGNGVVDTVSSSFFRGNSNEKLKRNIRSKVCVNYRFARKVAMTRPLCEASVIDDNCATLTKDDLFQKYWGLRKNAYSNCSTQKLKKQNKFQKDCSEDVNLRSGSEKSPSLSPVFIHSQILQQTRLMNDGVKSNKHEDSSRSKQSAMSPDSLVDCLVSNAKTEAVDWSQNNPTKQEFDSLSHTSFQQDTSEFHEDSVGSFHGAYEPSPISVLDPTFREDISSISQCDAGEYDSSEVDDRLDMNVSSDEECENESVRDFAEKKEILGLSRTEESRDFSYVVEVLTEAGISNKSLFKDFSTWHTSEFPISPFVFEILEKKFGEQQNWKRCERRLLFDHINLGLLEILQPHLYVPEWEKPVSRRVISEPSQDMIEEEMWGLLVSQEKNKDSEDNMLGGEIRWIEIYEDVEDIVRNIVKLLIEELANEIVRLEDF